MREIFQIFNSKLWWDQVAARQVKGIPEVFKNPGFILVLNSP